MSMQGEIGVIHRPIHLNVLPCFEVNGEIPENCVYSITFDSLLLPTIGLVSSIFVDPRINRSIGTCSLFSLKRDLKVVDPVC